MKQQLTTPDGTPASRFAFGTMQFGGRADAAASRAMFDACRMAGITHFDTAHIYTDGASETLLGEMARAERDKLLIATKIGYVGGGDPATLRAQFDRSRTRLGMDMVDVLYLHLFDPLADLSVTMETLAQFRAEGSIRYIGLSNFAAWQVVKATLKGQEFDLAPAILQPMYNLVKRQAEVEILPMAQDFGLTVAPYSPLGGGLLTGKYSPQNAGANGGTNGNQGRLEEDKRYAARYGPRWMHEAATQLLRIAADVGQSPATLAVAWVAAHAAMPVPIISGRSAAQLAPSLAAIDYDLSPELYARLSAISPTPPPATDRTEDQS